VPINLHKKYQILTAVLVPTLLSLALLVFVVRDSLHNWARDRWLTDHAAFASSLQESIQASLSQSTELLRFAALSPEFASLPELAKIDRTLNGLPEHLDGGKRLLLEHLRVSGNFSVLFVLTPEGDHYISHPFAVQKELKKYNLADRPYFQQAKVSKSITVSESFAGADGERAIAIDIPVLNAAGDIVLHLGGVLHLKQLSDLIAANHIAPFDEALVLDKRGNKIAESDPSRLSQAIAQPFLSHPGLTTAMSAAPKGANHFPSQQSQFSDPKGEEWLSIETQMPNGWHLFLLKQDSKLQAEIAPQVHKITALMAAALILPSLLGLWLALRFSKRWHLTDKNLQSANEELENRVALRTSELQRSETRHRTLFESAADAVLIIHHDHFVDCNPAALALFGANKAEEILSKRPSALSPVTQSSGEDSQILASRLLAKVLSSNDGQLSFEWTHRRLDNEADFTAAVHLSRMEIDGDIFIQAHLRDITDVKRARESLRIAATVFESHEGMTVTDANNVILRVNAAFSRITGYSAEEAVGKTPTLLSSGRHDAAFYADMRLRLQTEGAWQNEIWNRRKNGEVYPEWLTITAVKNEAGEVTHYVAIFVDITSRKATENRVQHLAFYDPLTQLPNRRLLLNRLEQALATSARHKLLGALLFVDLDNFKTINDTLGHEHGDRLLEQAAQRLSDCMREGDTVARIGGDEFVVMLEELADTPMEAANHAEGVAEKIRFSLGQPYTLAGSTQLSTTSIGVTLFGGNTATTVDEPIKHAELAMFQAKASGRNAVRFFDPQMQAVVSARASMEAELREALELGQLELHYQAQVVGDGRLTGAEALVRWNHPLRGQVSPVEFIGLAEETGLILPLGQWVLETACEQLALWSTRHGLDTLTVAVNVSSRQFLHPDFVQQVLDTLERTGASAKRLKLELTESLLVSDVDDVIAKMVKLKAHGVGFSLDDFGTGYSSLSYLKRLPLDQLKIDQGFVRNILTDGNDAAIAKMVVALAESLGLSVIAEGVEMQAQKEFLARLGCHAYQGYLYGRPVNIQAFEALAATLRATPIS
jgi:diguanylate cyclase (GGDEF)-like protein/PAS domain S-box-containing protein